MPAPISSSALRAARCCDPNPAIAACSVRTVQCRARPFSWRAPKMVGTVVGDLGMTETTSCAPVGTAKSRDWLRQPIGIIFWWALPIALGISTNFWHPPLAQTGLIWTLALAWMGTGCALNALRCGRRHCFISAPVLWLGAIAAGLVGFGVISSPNALGEAVNGALALAALSFLSEWFWGLYAERK